MFSIALRGANGNSGKKLKKLAKFNGYEDQKLITGIKIGTSFDKGPVISPSSDNGLNFMSFS